MRKKLLNLLCTGGGLQEEKHIVLENVKSCDSSKGDYTHSRNGVYHMRIFSLVFITHGK